MKNNPYVGPRPYERKGRHNFHGRNREARELRALIVAEREARIAELETGRNPLDSETLEAPRLEQ
jgi:hypothetical protein